ncbi:uncharacterized protein [Chelonus insularis]|uniref:uncharacterized protein n=1 Tax=Chelonus insularis TaxID=460826 RepID=UPI0015897BD7|nr:uncharacterized protein LOC118068756 [Chelonus insularis]
MNQIAVKDLQSIIQQTFGKEIIVESYETKDFLPPGENYGSKIVSVDAKIRKTKSNKIENLYMIAKLPPPTQFQRDMFDTPFTFKKEIFMYSEIFPAYKKLEIDNGINENKVFNNHATYYGSRLSLNSNVEFDDDAAIVLENLKVQGYYMVDRKIGCDLNHSKIAIQTLARFHSLGIAMKHKNPSFFEVLKIKSKCLEFKNPESWESIMKSLSTTIEHDEKIKQYFPSCEKAFSAGTAESWRAIPDEPWSSIIHADFWTNNFMFHKSAETGIPDDIKFVDFQNYLFLSPLRELAFFLGVGLESDVFKTHYNDLVDYYYQVLIERLQLLNCDVTPYSRDTFNEQLRKDTCIEFTHCACMLKIITIDVDASDPNAHNVKSLLESSPKNEIFINRVRNYVTLLCEQNWLD